MHLPPIIEDLAVILIVAGVMTLLFRAIRQPVVLGYLVAGFLVGPHFKWIPTIFETEGVKVWAEIGVIFLLFGLGLEFSFKKLMRVGAPASITAFIEVAGMVFIGFFLGRAFGWTGFDSIFLGGILAISSTTIIIRAFDELGMKTRGFVRLVFGVLIIEDLVAILLLVVLSTIALSRNFSGIEMGVSALKLGFFLVLWFVLGIFLVPTFLKQVQKYLRQETLLIVSLGLCFSMVVLATKVGFSPALGAFIMGSILAETMDGERIEHLIQPIKDLFGAIFFVSVGMLIDPQILIEYSFPIFVILLVTILGKFVTTAVGGLIAGQSLRHSVQAGMSLAQIGEFSFIIASLGLSLKVTSEFLYPIAISVSAVTTFTTPYLIRSSDFVVNALERHLPTRTLEALERFRVASATVAQISDWRVFLRRSSLKVMTNGVVVTAIFLTVSEFFKPWLYGQISNLKLAQSVSLLVAFLLSAPFLWAITGGRYARQEARVLWSERRFVGPLIAFEICRWIFAVVLCGVLSSRIVPPGIVILFVGFIVIIGVYVFSRSFESIYVRLERSFFHNLNEKEMLTKRKELPALAPWDTHLSEVRVSPDSSLIGKKLSDLMIRERYGVTIALIARGRRVIPAPSRNDVVYPSDSLQVIGTDEQIKRFAQECDGTDLVINEVPDFNYVLKSVYVDSSAAFANKTIRDSGLREKTHGLVVGIEKRGRRTLNPDSSTIIEPGDVLWVVGNQDLMTGI